MLSGFSGHHKGCNRYITSPQPGDCLHWGCSPFYPYNPLGLPACGVALPLFRNGLALPIVNPFWKPRGLLYYLSHRQFSLQASYRSKPHSVLFLSCCRSEGSCVQSYSSHYLKQKADADERRDGWEIPWKTNTCEEMLMPLCIRESHQLCGPPPGQI